ncbi:CpsB/CapC family capsule biosynthesis tyrosine phosphatase [Seonamhaeicola sp.]|uniref:tyrosine-protein phosphatase n=1 Tax=Seonamhaeicola sp. TaxID=1912245 RepID=UPI002605E7F1|nr:CpsB/CapC family capsule biosynthesis tyrosine phosphatase [Seonamhaeicola sp.]
MFHFFSKKLFLKDLLEGFVDIHNHILPGIDDGAKTVHESIDLILSLKELGAKEFIPTPHVMQDFYPNTDETIGDSYGRLLEALNKTKLLSEVTINPAAEYMLDDNFEKLLKTKDLYTLKKSYVLVEISYFQPPLNLEDIIFDIKTHGYLPVLAHPERYAYYHKKLDYYKRLKQLGCFFQLNLLSLTNHYGNNVEKTAKRLIEENLIDFIGSDVHNKNHVMKLSKSTISNNKIFDSLKQVIRNTNTVFSVT